MPIPTRDDQYLCFAFFANLDSQKLRDLRLIEADHRFAVDERHRRALITEVD